MLGKAPESSGSVGSSEWILALDSTVGTSECVMGQVADVYQCLRQTSLTRVCKERKNVKALRCCPVNWPRLAWVFCRFAKFFVYLLLLLLLLLCQATHQVQQHQV
jgi:hypothetical protein